MSRGKRWVFTLNNYSEQEYESIIRFLGEHSSYYVIGKEKGENGTPHLQGYAELSERVRFLSLKNKIGSRSHLELARGTGEENRTYCSKEGDFVEHGRLGVYRSGNSRSGNSATRDELGNKFDTYCKTSGVLAGCKQFAKEEPGCFFFSGSTLLRNFFSIMEPPRRDEIEVWWYYGPPGTGKSRRAYELAPEAYRKDCRTKWWHGYMMQKDCVIDDVGRDGIDITRFLVWFDRYPCIVENKGGMLPLCVVKFWVTSNFHPEELFKFGNEVHPQLPALMRRINLLEFS